MSYIQDDEQMIKSCIKYIDEDKIVDFLNSIEFEFDDSDVDNYILQTSNSKLIGLCIDSYLDEGYIEDLLDMVDNDVVSNTALTIIKNKLVKQENPDIIYQILNSNLVTWRYNECNPFTSGYIDFKDNNVSDESILNQEEVYVLFSIYAKHEYWICGPANEYVKDKDSLAAYLEEADTVLHRYGYYNTQKLIEWWEDDLQDYFDGNIPDKIDAYTLADLYIKRGIYSTY